MKAFSYHWCCSREHCQEQKHIGNPNCTLASVYNKFFNSVCVQRKPELPFTDQRSLREEGGDPHIYIWTLNSTWRVEHSVSVGVEDTQMNLNSRWRASKIARVLEVETDLLELYVKWIYKSHLLFISAACCSTHGQEDDFFSREIHRWLSGSKQHVGFTEQTPACCLRPYRLAKVPTNFYQCLSGSWWWPPTLLHTSVHHQKQPVTLYVSCTMT